MNPLVHDLVAIIRIFGAFERDQVCCGAFTVQQCVTMQVLLEGPLEVAQLAARVDNSPSAMTRLVEGLANRALVQRTRDAEDRRRVRVSLTKEGQKAAKELERATEDAVGAVMSEIPKKKHKQVESSLRILRMAMEECREQFDCES